MNHLKYSHSHLEEKYKELFEKMMSAKTQNELEFFLSQLQIIDQLLDF